MGLLVMTTVDVWGVSEVDVVGRTEVVDWDLGVDVGTEVFADVEIDVDASCEVVVASCVVVVVVVVVSVVGTEKNDYNIK